MSYCDTECGDWFPDKRAELGYPHCLSCVETHTHKKRDWVGVSCQPLKDTTHVSQTKRNYKQRGATWLTPKAQ